MSVPERCASGAFDEQLLLVGTVLLKGVAMGAFQDGVVCHKKVRMCWEQAAAERLIDGGVKENFIALSLSAALRRSFQRSVREVEVYELSDERSVQLIVFGKGTGGNSGTSPLVGVRRVCRLGLQGCASSVSFFGSAPASFCMEPAARRGRFTTVKTNGTTSLRFAVVQEAEFRDIDDASEGGRSVDPATAATDFEVSGGRRKGLSTKLKSDIGAKKLESEYRRENVKMIHKVRVHDDWDEHDCTWLRP